MSKKSIIIDGKTYKVVDDLGFQAGMYVKEVETPQGEEMAVASSKSGPWRFWTVVDRLQSPSSGPVGQQNTDKEQA